MVALWDTDAELVAQTRSAVAEQGHVVANPMDVTDLSSAEAAVARTTEEFGRLDILVNNGGIAGPTVKTWGHPAEEWQRVIEIDLTGVFYCCRAAVPNMIAQNYGRIVSVASIAGKEGNPNASAFSAAKAGVIALIKSLGKELADYDISVNSITPAAAKIRIFKQISQEHIDYMLSTIPR